MTFKELLERELNRRGWTLWQLSDDSGIDYEDLVEVIEGKDPQEYVVDILTTQFINPKTGERFIYPHELIEYCQIKVVPNRLND